VGGVCQGQPRGKKEKKKKKKKKKKKHWGKKMNGPVPEQNGDRKRSQVQRKQGKHVFNNLEPCIKLM